MKGVRRAQRGAGLRRWALTGGGQRCEGGLLTGHYGLNDVQGVVMGGGGGEARGAYVGMGIGSVVVGGGEGVGF